MDIFTCIYKKIFTHEKVLGKVASALQNVFCRIAVILGHAPMWHIHSNFILKFSSLRVWCLRYNVLHTGENDVCKYAWYNIYNIYVGHSAMNLLHPSLCYGQG